MHILITHDDGYLVPGVKVLTQDAGKGTHCYAIAHHTESATPMQIYLTRYRGIHPLQNWLDTL